MDLPSIVNDSDYDLKYDQLCIYRVGTSVSTTGEITTGTTPRKCIDMPETLYPYEKFGFTATQV